MESERGAEDGDAVFVGTARKALQERPPWGGKGAALTQHPQCAEPRAGRHQLW